MTGAAARASAGRAGCTGPAAHPCQPAVPALSPAGRADRAGRAVPADRADPAGSAVPAGPAIGVHAILDERRRARSARNIKRNINAFTITGWRHRPAGAWGGRRRVFNVMLTFMMRRLLDTSRRRTLSPARLLTIGGQP